MPKTLIIQFNGQPRTIETIEDPATLATVIVALELKPDRIAVELNGEIVRRVAWPEAVVRANDRLEIVHFVGGGLA
jgi:sulfur carrier protein